MSIKPILAQLYLEVIEEVKSKLRRIVRKMLHSVRFWLIILIPLTWILRAITCIPAVADTYNRYIYRYISVFFQFLSGLIPFSLAEFVVIFGILGILAFIVYAFVKVIKSVHHRFAAFFNVVLNALCMVALGLFFFTTNCGINYNRSSFAQLSGMTVQAVSTEQLYDTCVILADNAAQYGEKVKRNSDGITVLSDTAANDTATAVNSLSQKYDFIYDGYSAPKKVLLSKGMSYLDITGIFFPYTFEANVNTDVPAFSIPFTMCHELAHVHGLMREEEANFTAFLACINADSDELKYSGYMEALSYAANALRKADNEKYAQLYRHFSEKMLQDYSAQSEYWQSFRTPIAATASAVNDSYLKSNAQSNGIQSYGEMVDLVVAYYSEK